MGLGYLLNLILTISDPKFALILCESTGEELEVGRYGASGRVLIVSSRTRGED